MMLLYILTLLLCVSNADVIFNFEDNTSLSNYEDQPSYNIHLWIKELQLQTCAIVAIGLKYFALFVENIAESKNDSFKSTKFFLGICHQKTLEKWNFCSENLTKNRKHKCKFKLKTGIYQNRVHRRFCDFKVMVKNMDCNCVPTILSNQMNKVRGFPTCYIPPLPQTLCKYNVCGLSKCRPLTVQHSVHSVECHSECTAGNPFCEAPIHRTSLPPKIRSEWSKWSHLQNNVTDVELLPGESSAMIFNSKKRRSIATCINKYTGNSDLDCLGPGTGCCLKNFENCSCETYEEGLALKVDRSYFYKKSKKSTKYYFQSKPRKRKRINRLLRDTKNDVYDDDDDENEDLDEDIVLEEDTTQTTATTTEVLERSELEEKAKSNMKKEIEEINKNNTLALKNGNNSVRKYSRLTLLVTNILFINKLS